jgi:hypothetical protein
MNSWKTETCTYICESKKYFSFWMTDSQIVNALEQFQLGCTKSNIGVKLGGRNII